MVEEEKKRQHLRRTTVNARPLEQRGEGRGNNQGDVSVRDRVGTPKSETGFLV
jgi:hypothetical protein